MRAPNKQKQECSPFSSKKLSFISAADGNHFRNLQWFKVQITADHRVPNSDSNICQVTPTPKGRRTLQKGRQQDCKSQKIKIYAWDGISYPWQRSHTSEISTWLPKQHQLTSQCGWGGEISQGPTLEEEPQSINGWWERKNQSSLRMSPDRWSNPNWWALDTWTQEQH